MIHPKIYIKILSHNNLLYLIHDRLNHLPPTKSKLRVDHIKSYPPYKTPIDPSSAIVVLRFSHTYQSNLNSHLLLFEFIYFYTLLNVYSSKALY